jgi:FkbM family methyltransferase
MRWRGQLKYWLYGCCPGIAGSCTYHGTKFHFPRRSVSFRAFCASGVFEPENTALLTTLAKPKTWMFDVGANIGLMSIPVLARVPDVHVVSFEPSPNTVPWLARTVRESGHGDRWQMVSEAVGASCGTTKFNVSNLRYSLWDGRQDTGRVPSSRTVEVKQTTLDATWEGLGSPAVSLIKCDVEGGELDVLRGARRLLATCKPAVLLEWQPHHLPAYGLASDSILSFAEEVGYSLHSVPSGATVTGPAHLEAMTAFTESFLLLPKHI